MCSSPGIFPGKEADFERGLQNGMSALRKMSSLTTAAASNSTALKNGRKKSVAASGGAAGSKTKGIINNGGSSSSSAPSPPRKNGSKKPGEEVSASINEKGNEANSATGGGGIFRPFVVLALPGVNLFRKFSQYRRLPQEPPPKDKLEVELERLNNKIDNLLDKLDEVEAEKASNPDEECIICESNKATMQTFPCTHQVVCRTCFVRTIQTTVAQKKLPLRCILCRAKILRLKQHHKGQHGPHRRVVQPQVTSEAGQASGVPQSVSSYSITRLSSSSSNQSFASGVSSVSSGSNVSIKSTRSFNFDNFANFQNVNLVHKNHLTRTASGSSFSGRRRSRSPSPVGIGVRSRSVDGRMPKITVDRTPSDESLASSCAQVSITSPGSSSSPRSPISPPWASSSALGAKAPSNSSGGAFFPGNGNGSANGSPNSPPGNCNSLHSNSGLNNGLNNAVNNLNHAENVNAGVEHSMLQQPCPTLPARCARNLRLCTPLSPIKESKREGSGSSQELRWSPEPPVDNKDHVASLIMWDDEEGDLKQTTPVRNEKYNPQKPSSRIRCADKILTQLEIHADAKMIYSNKHAKLASRTHLRDPPGLHHNTQSRRTMQQHHQRQISEKMAELDLQTEKPFESDLMEDMIATATESILPTSIDVLSRREAESPRRKNINSMRGTLGSDTRFWKSRHVESTCEPDKVRICENCLKITRFPEAYGQCCNDINNAFSWCKRIFAYTSNNNNNRG